jgi:hypothetical protein
VGRRPAGADRIKEKPWHGAAAFGGGLRSDRMARSVPWRLRSGLRQQSIPFDYTDALQCFELLKDCSRNCAIQAPHFVM